MVHPTKCLFTKNIKTLKKTKNFIISESPLHYNQLLENDNEGFCELIGGENKSCNSKRQRRKEATFCAAGIEPTPHALEEQGMPAFTN